MRTRETIKKTNRLSREILGLILADGAISLFLFSFLQMMAVNIAHAYCYEQDIILSETQEYTLVTWVSSISLLAAILFFVVIFFVLLGQKLSYIREITDGIDALRTHRMHHEVEVKGENELTDLAKSINYLAETEQQLKAMERNLSHDIRTPLTAILSYSEYMQGKTDLDKAELDEFLELIKRKAEQIKVLTERLLDGGSQLTEIQDGRLLMVQLTEEWMESLEEHFSCRVDLEHCPTFSRQLDIEELRRIFDNLSSNIKKYADETAPVLLGIFANENRLVIKQTNQKRDISGNVESRKIGLVSIDTIAKHHGGSMKIEETKESFSIEITLFTLR